MNPFEQALQKLNNAQRTAVDTLYGPVMVVAGPGTGKTQILSLRIAQILKQTDANPENILCLTFTDAGVKAMNNRLRSFIGNEAYKVAIYTFHGFTNDIIQNNPDYFKFTKDLKQIDDITQISFVRSIIDDLESSDKEYKLVPFYDKYAKVRDILSSISSLKLENISADVLKERNETLKKEHEENVEYNTRGKNKGKPKTTWIKYKEKLEVVDEFIEIYEKYRELMEEKGFYDFNDMILFVITAFENHPELLAEYQEKYQFIHVDEFQDTNGSQNAIIRLLGSSDVDSSPNIFIVGDDDQAIYRFQGANLDNILSFNDVFNNVTVIPTLINYRSTQKILDIADSVIDNNQNRLSKKIADLSKKLSSFITKESTEADDKAEIWSFSNATEEALFLAKEVGKLIDSGTKPEEIAILYRKHADAEEIARIFSKFDIETDISVSANVFEHEFIAKLIELFELIQLFSPDSSELLYKVLLFDFLDFDTVSVYKLAKKARSEKKDFFDFLTNLKSDDLIDSELNIEQVEKIIAFVEKLFGWHALAHNTSLVSLFESILTDLNIIDFLTKQSNQFDSVLALNSFFSYIQKRESIETDFDLTKFINERELITSNNIKISLPKVTKSGAVNLLTAHSSKGLEFEYVFLIKATSTNWGASRARYSIVPNVLINENFDKENEKTLVMEDERRLFFVALTRAKKRVYITYAEEYLDFNGNTTKVAPSQFIHEIDTDHLLYKSTIETEDSKPDLVLDTTDFLTQFKKIDDHPYSDEEKKYLLDRLENFSLSPSALNSYLRSPEEFKYRYLLNLPQRVSKELALGTAIHSALELFNRNILKNNNAPLELLIKDFTTNLTKSFESDDDFERTKEEGISLLNDYYDGVLSKNDFSLLTGVEYNFGFHNIYLPLENGNPIKLSGRLDAIELISADSNEVKVIDYKTGSPKTSGQILGTTKSSTGDIWRQLVFYKLMGDLDTNFRKNSKTTTLPYKIRQAEVRFIKQKNNKFSEECFDVTESDVEQLKQLIEIVMGKMRNLEFPEETDIEL